MARNGVKHIRSSPYHPSTNGLAERFVRTLKKSSNFADPHVKLMNFLLSYRSTPHSTTNTTPSELFLHRSLRTRLDLLRPDLGVAVSQKQASQKKNHDLHSHSRDFFVGERVLVRNMLSGPWWLVGTVVERRGPLSYLVQVANGVVWKRHVDHLRRTIDSPQEEEETAVPDTNTDDSRLIPSSPSDEDQSSSLPAVIVPVNNEQPDTTEVPSEESSVVDNTASRTSPPRRYPQRVRRPPERFHEQYF